MGNRTGGKHISAHGRAYTNDNNRHAHTGNNNNSYIWNNSNAYPCENGNADANPGNSPTGDSHTGDYRNTSILIPADNYQTA